MTGRPAAQTRMAIRMQKGMRQCFGWSLPYVFSLERIPADAGVTVCFGRNSPQAQTFFNQRFYPRSIA
jgi:hypothetical protein